VKEVAYAKMTDIPENVVMEVYKHKELEALLE
jgi:hypothetical protein